MQIEVTVNTVQELVLVARVEQSVIADHLGLSKGMAGLKIRGVRPVFVDEIPALRSAINSTGYVHVDDEDLMTLYRKCGTMKVRGLATTD